MNILINNTTEYDLSNYYTPVNNAVRETLRLEKWIAGNNRDIDNDNNNDKEYEVSVTFVTNEEIKDMNRRYRNVDAVTDVLSFPADGASTEEIKILGDIIISFDQALCQAKQYGNTGKREIAFLTAHGMLHLLGYDHTDTESEIIMMQKQKEIMKAFE